MQKIIYLILFCTLCTPLLFAGERPGTALFKYRPPQAINRVFVAGEFNGWNPTANELVDADGDGTYEIAITLAPGSYQYKFVVDGRWIQDPSHQKSMPDGFGGFNSVIEVAGTQIGEFAGISKKSVAGNLEFLLKYLPAEGGKGLDAGSIVVKINGDPIDKKHIKWNRNKSELKVSVPLRDNGVRQEGLAAQDMAYLRHEGHYVSVTALDKDGVSVPEFSFLEKGTTPARDAFDWRDAVIYFVFIDRFFNGDPANDRGVDDSEVAKIANYSGGDFAGITQKIKDGYFSELGINAIWLSPVIDNPPVAFRDALPPHKKFTGYHGYWPVSFTELEENFGTMEELKQLVEAAHTHGIRIILDMVLNHIHKDNPLYKQHPEWFSKLALPDGRKNIRLFDERPLDTWFDAFLPDFDYENNPAAVAYMVDNCMWWIKQTGCDGFRLDAVKHMPDIFWKELQKRIRNEIEIPHGKNFYLLGETISGRDKIMEYVGREGLDGQFDFPLYWAIRDVFGFGSAGFNRLESERKKSEWAYTREGVVMSPLLGNHDFARFMAFADGDIRPGMDEKSLSWSNQPEVNNPESYKKLQLAFLFLLTQPGAPMIYCGDEIGLTGAGDPDNRRMMKFDGLTKDERETREFVSKIISMRNKKPAIRYGAHKTLYVSEKVYVYAKQYFDDFVIVGMNLSDTEQEVSVGLPGYFPRRAKLNEYLTNKKIKVDGRQLKIKIKPLSAVVIL